MLINVPLAFICLPLNTGSRDDALNCVSPFELFTSSLGPPDNISERLSAIIYWAPIRSSRPDWSPRSLGIFSALPIVVVVAVFLFLAFVVYIHFQRSRRITAGCLQNCLQRDSHTFAFPGPISGSRLPASSFVEEATRNRCRVYLFSTARFPR